MPHHACAGSRAQASAVVRRLAARAADRTGFDLTTARRRGLVLDEIGIDGAEVDRLVASGVVVDGGRAVPDGPAGRAGT